MSRKKEARSAVIYLRLKPSTKKALENLAEREIRSVSQMLEYIILDYLKRDKKKE